jgi:hypothetical protein
MKVDPMMAVGRKSKFVNPPKLFGPYLKLELGFRVTVENFD